MGAAPGLCSWNSDSVINTTSSASNAGVSTFPSRSTSPDGFNANQVATAKNTRLNPTDASVLSHPVTGETAVEKLTAPVRGIPKNVPIDK